MGVDFSVPRMHEYLREKIRIKKKTSQELRKAALRVVGFQGVEV